MMLAVVVLMALDCLVLVVLMAVVEGLACFGPGLLLLCVVGSQQGGGACRRQEVIELVVAGFAYLMLYVRDNPPWLCYPLVWVVANETSE
jgi:hypothetical protein